MDQAFNFVSCNIIIVGICEISYVIKFQQNKKENTDYGNIWNSKLETFCPQPTTRDKKRLAIRTAQ